MIKGLYLKVLSILSPEKYARRIGVKIGKNCLIYRSIEWPSEPYLVTIGDNVQLTRGVAIHTHGGGHVARRIHPEFDMFGKIVIQNWVYIGAHSQILPGVTIGEGAIVAAGSIVTKSVASGMVVGGNPAKVICSVEDYIARNLKYNLNTKNMSQSEKMHFLENLSDNSFVKK